MCLIEHDQVNKQMNLKKLRNIKYENIYSLSLLFILFVLCTITNLVYKGVKLYKNKPRLFIIIVLLLWFSLVFLYHRIDTSCDGWEKGLNGSLINSEDYCIIDRPYICWPVVLNNWFKFGPDTCEILDQNTITLNKIKALEYYKFIPKNITSLAIKK